MQLKRYLNPVLNFMSGGISLWEHLLVVLRRKFHFKNLLKLLIQSGLKLGGLVNAMQLPRFFLLSTQLLTGFLLLSLNLMRQRLQTIASFGNYASKQNGVAMT